MRWPLRTDRCVACHRQASPGHRPAVRPQQHGGRQSHLQRLPRRSPPITRARSSTRAAYVLPSPTTAMCQKCHQQEVAQYNQSRHGMPAWVAVRGQQGSARRHVLAAIPGHPGGPVRPGQIAQRDRRAWKARISPTLPARPATPSASPPRMSSVGQCQKCHLRHEFSLEQARKPETCNACHIGPDHPQWEIYIESPHGIAYMTGGDTLQLGSRARHADGQRFPRPHLRHLPHQRFRRHRHHPRCGRAPDLVPVCPDQRAPPGLAG